ncbi:hypothetical protein [Virgibacillus sediminis]|uniref:DUF4305 domain-containing protein n=1 Tax=Virgibacillus sediminis TaxID=202260 RepID=A0ABV7A6Y4_9BACI
MISRMFFKNASQEEKKNADISGRATFIFWGIFLLVNAASELVYDKPVISSSLIILISGLVVFFTTDLILKLKRRNGK